VIVFHHKFRGRQLGRKEPRERLLNFVSHHTRGDSALPVPDLPVFCCVKVLQECEKEDVHRSFPSPSPLLR
jgi:hypothetical protein